MALHVDDKILQFDYIDDRKIYDKVRFFKDNGDEKFDINSKSQMLLMLQSIVDELQIKDEYSVKRLETMLRFELPFFAINRRLIRNWILENFIY